MGGRIFLNGRFEHAEMLDQGDIIDETFKRRDPCVLG